jgi:hypothetical protein
LQRLLLTRSERLGRRALIVLEESGGFTWPCAPLLTLDQRLQTAPVATRIPVLEV